MVRSIVVDFPEKPLKRTLTRKQIDKVKRDRARERKLERLIRKFDNLPTDEIETWVDDDFNEMEAQLDESEQFCNDLSKSFDFPIKTTGSRWHNYHKPLGRFIKSIRASCDEDDKTTILIIRGHDEVVYRLGVQRGKEDKLLHTCINEGYVMSKIKISNVDED